MSKDLSVREAADKLGMKPQQVLNRVKRGTIPGTKDGWFWKIKPSTVRKILTNQKVSI